MVGNSIIFSSSFPLSQQPISIRSSSLRPLKLSWASERNLTIDLNPSRLFLNRVTIFELFHQGSIASVNILVTLFSSLCMLEEFTWTGSIGHPQDLRQIRESVNRRLKLRVLSIGMTMLPLFPSFSLTDLVILTVTSTTSDEKEGSLEEEYKLIHLPRLKELIERGSWYGLRHIEAPSLQRLRLLGYDGKSENVAQMKLDPAFVEIHDGGTGKIIEALAKRASSLNFTELHICHPCSSVYEDGRLAEIFSPDRARSSSLLFPRLKHLLVELRPKHPDIPRPDNEKCKELIEASFNGFPYLVTVR
ncbi:hypothetical protein FRC14_008064 [Serendipita sp. 396]|nr:hypothetical protein FRC14_008064 [Serendipita sp. 396]KAG8871580.1 hypothetical protein FRC20_010403 [Serendipita sp. 405]